MYHVKQLNGPSRLVCLEMPNQMPTDSIASDDRDFRLGFLNAVFSKVTGTKIYQLLDEGGGMSLADCN
jgi:hypothetical protein